MTALWVKAGLAGALDFQLVIGSSKAVPFGDEMDLGLNKRVLVYGVELSARSAAHMVMMMAVARA